MPNYKESTLPCTSFVRACGVTCMNSRDGVRMIQFQEETVLRLPDGTETASRSGECSQFLTAANAATAFMVRDAVTGDPTGITMTYAEVYQALMSLYYHVAELRDAGGGGSV